MVKINNKSVLVKSVKVMKDKKRQRCCYHSPTKLPVTKERCQPNAVDSWIEFWKRKRPLVEKLMKFQQDV